MTATNQCPVCNRLFVQGRINNPKLDLRKFCSAACKQKHYRQRKEQQGFYFYRGYAYEVDRAVTL